MNLILLLMCATIRMITCGHTRAAGQSAAAVRASPLYIKRARATSKHYSRFKARFRKTSLNG